MKRFVRNILLAGALSLTAGMPAQAGELEQAAQAFCEKVGAGQLYKPSLSEAKKWLKAEGYTISTSSDDSIVLKVNGIKAVLFRMDDGDWQMYYGAKGPKPSYKQINEWNRTKRLSRAYLDEEMDPVLEADLDATVGITKSQLLNFVKIFVDVSMPAYRKYILGL